MNPTAEPTRRERTLVALSTGGALAAVTVGSWLMIDGTIDLEWFGQSGIPDGESCPPAVQQPVVPERVEISVLNATNEPGLAGEAAEELGERGFRVAEVDNDYYANTEFEGIIRVGEKGLRQAYTLQQHLPETLVDVDDREDFSVELVLGSEFSWLQADDDVVVEPGRLSCAG